jgi:hypothetical protein
LTNANVDQVVTAVDGQTLTPKYKDGENSLCSRRHANRCLRAGGQYRSQAWCESLHRCGQAAGWNAAGSRVMDRSGWSNTADVIAARGTSRGFGTSPWTPPPLEPLHRDLSSHRFQRSPSLSSLSMMALR